MNFWICAVLNEPTAELIEVIIRLIRLLKTQLQSKNYFQITSN